MSMLAWSLTFYGGNHMADATVHLTEQNFDEILAQAEGVLMEDF